MTMVAQQFSWDDDERCALKPRDVWNVCASINRQAFVTGAKNEGQVHSLYKWQDSDELGRGGFGCVYRARSQIDPHHEVAIKQINKRKVDNMDQLKSEIAILHTLDHPNILRLHEEFHDYKFVYLVMELCTGGDLVAIMDRVVGNEVFAASCARQVCGALVHCHSRSVCHRDLKLDNVLLMRPQLDAQIKVADFGLAKLNHQRNENAKRAVATPTASPARKSSNVVLARKNSRHVVRMTTFCGTVDTMAPEVIRVLQQQQQGIPATPYDFRCDVWSLGVIIFALMNGDYPFTLEQISAYVEDGQELPNIESAKGVAEASDDIRSWLTKCLIPDPHERPQAAELISHAFVQKATERVKAKKNTECHRNSISQLGQFAKLSQFKRAALTAAARKLKAFELEQFRSVFEQIDIDNSGTVTLQELRQAMESSPKATDGQVLPLNDVVEQLLSVLDSDMSGEIDYTEFIAAIMDSRLEQHEELAWQAFRAFDMDGDGHITKAELRDILACDNRATKLAALSDAQKLDDLMKRGDVDGDGEISFEEFLDMLKEGL